MTSISGARIGAVGAATRGAGGSGGKGPAATMGAIASEVAATITAELGLTALDPDGRRKRGQIQDFYGIDDAAAELAENLQATPGEAGEIARLLHLFAAEVAARVGAIPDKRSVEDIARRIRRDGSDVGDARGAILAIDRAVRELAA